MLLNFIILFCYLSSSTNPNYFQYLNDSTKNSIQTIQLSFVGDIMCHSPQFEFARIGKNSFDFKPAFREIKKFLSKSDFTFGNLETVILGGNEKLSGYPLFNSPPELLDAVKDAGIDFLFTSNNHCNDKGIRGIENTINHIRERGIGQHGTFLSKSNRDSSLIISINEFNIGILSYTYGLNGNYLPKEKIYMASLIDTNQVKFDIDKFSQHKLDCILIYYHFGNEYSRKPSNYQKELVKKTFEYGADIIIASHPHVIQPFEYFIKDKGKMDKGFVAYSLGNFISNQRWRYSDSGIILDLQLTKSTLTDSVWISKVDFTPTWVFKGKTSNGNEFIILPSDTSKLNPIPNFIQKEDLFRLNQSFNDAHNIIKNIKATKISK
ncbi:MAG: CapA family protein [Ignavibacteria bacterium]|nr:CapA family protein [Ignavibacteria bacterium]